MVVSTITIYQVIVGAIAASPFLIHRLRVGAWSKRASLQLPEVNDSELPRITLVVPTWNEELSISSKLASLSAQEYPREKVEVIVIDSNSSDGTVGLVNTWSSTNSGNFSRIRVIEMDRRMGKTTAISQAFSSADQSSEVLVMTDVDARLDPGSIRRLGAWFTNPEIGAVGGTPDRHAAVNKAHVSSEQSYRGMFTIQRIGESERDSTPFLEGSILGIRKSVFSAGVLDLNCNADDSQLAVAARLSGLRAIQDRNLIFRDAIAPTYSEHRAQKIRRGQGLQRLLWRYRRHWFS